MSAAVIHEAFGLPIEPPAFVSQAVAWADAFELRREAYWQMPQHECWGAWGPLTRGTTPVGQMTWDESMREFLKELERLCGGEVLR